MVQYVRRMRDHLPASLDLEIIAPENYTTAAFGVTVCSFVVCILEVMEAYRPEAFSDVSVLSGSTAGTNLKIREIEHLRRSIALGDG